MYFIGFAIFIPLIYLACCRKRSSANDSRGEYRAVAAQYGDINYGDNAFSDDFSDDELSVDDDIEESWGKSGKRVLEMGSFSGAANGNGTNGIDQLSLEEMNG